MSPRPAKPSLVVSTTRQYVLVAAAVLLLVLTGLLWLTDQVMLTTRQRSLGNQVATAPAFESAVLLLCDLEDVEESGSVLLDPGGYWKDTDDGVIGRIGNPKVTGGWQQWTKAAEVVQAGSWRETGMLPWASEPVVWAADVQRAPDGHKELLVAWEPVRAVRHALLPVYTLVVGATLCAFIASVFLALRGARRMARAMHAVAESSERMADGDYAVKLRAQPTRELDRVSTSINQLAHSLRETSAALLAEQERLGRLERLQRQFIADASHELRAPLTSMRVTLEAWQDGVLEPEERTEAVGRLLVETERLAHLVTALLDLSRLESGRVVPELAPLEVREVALDVASALQDLPGAAIEVAMPANLPPVLADPDAVSRILLNLVANARRHTPPQGTIRIWARLDDHGVRVGVTDTGSGIDPALLPHIWDRFTRAEGRSTDTAGYGLGLAIVKALVESMGGAVGAESTPGQGATIWFHLPQAPALEPVAES